MFRDDDRLFVEIFLVYIFQRLSTGVENGYWGAEVFDC